jgi:hypothetical protein
VTTSPVLAFQAKELGVSVKLCPCAAAIVALKLTVNGLVIVSVAVPSRVAPNSVPIVNPPVPSALALPIANCPKSPIVVPPL